MIQLLIYSNKQYICVITWKSFAFSISVLFTFCNKDSKYCTVFEDKCYISNCLSLSASPTYCHVSFYPYSRSWYTIPCWVLFSYPPKFISKCVNVFQVKKALLLFLLCTCVTLIVDCRYLFSCRYFWII